jgi:DNA modification methylase
MDLRIHNVAEGIPLDDESVDVVVTSPPYFGLRAYGDNEDEIGQAEPLPDYLDRIESVMEECRRILKPSGLLWLNIGDTASGSGGAGGDYNSGGSKAGRNKWRQGETGLPPMTWCNIPARVSTRMIGNGWLLRSEIIWDKRIERREDLNHIRRVRPAHEMIYCFAKTKKYRWDPEGLTETGSVWHFPPSSGAGRGPAPFPYELVERCLRPSGIGSGDVVVDPFAGSGTSLTVAEEFFGAKAIGFDLYAPESDDE